MVCLPSLRLFPTLCVAIIAANHKCSGFRSSLVVASRFGPHYNSECEKRINYSFREESIDATPLSKSNASALSSSRTTADTRPKHSYSWVDRVYQLIEYKETHGDLLVPKRYGKNPSLGNWVNKQRVQYRKFLANETPCSMTKKKVEVLNELGFCWDGTLPKTPERRLQDKEERWWIRLEEFRNKQESDEKKRSPVVDRWLRQQRNEYESYKNGVTAFSCLDEKKVEALHAVDPDWWKGARQRKWEQRIQELLAYKEEHGDCCVPINYPKNKKLGNWVSNCRKQYRLRENGEASNMTQERIDQLNSIGFAWDRWEFKFEQTMMLEDSV